MSLIRDILSLQEGRSTYLHLKQQFLLNCCKEFFLSSDTDFELTHTSSVNCLDVDINGRYLLSGAKNGTIIIHDLFNYTGIPSYRCKALVSIRRTEGSNNIAFSIETAQWYPFDSGLFTTSGMDNFVKLWDTESKKMFEKFHFNGKIYHHHISPVGTGTTPLIGVATETNQVFLLDMRSGQCSHELRGHTSSVMCCAWSPTHTYYLASGSCDSSICLWDIRSARARLGALDFRNRQDSAQAHNGFVNGITFTPDGRLLMSLGTDNQLRCWDFHMQKHREIVYEDVHIRKNKAIKFGVFGYGNLNVCLVPSDSNINIYEIETGMKLNTLSGHYNLVNTCYFQKDRLELYSGGQDRNILFWTRFKALNDSEDTYCTQKAKKMKVEADNWSDDEG
uniref:Uncharacterized protein n=1 Tax=Graphocephala atropunctata TaxID=36148 RepID=A0A1B6M7U1_9HEMI